VDGPCAGNSSLGIWPIVDEFLEPNRRCAGGVPPEEATVVSRRGICDRTPRFFANYSRADYHVVSLVPMISFQSLRGANSPFKPSFPSSQLDGSQVERFLCKELNCRGLWEDLCKPRKDALRIVNVRASRIDSSKLRLEPRGRPATF
jgi:hypothetical protein